MVLFLYKLPCENQKEVGSRFLFNNIKDNKKNNKNVQF